MSKSLTLILLNPTEIQAQVQQDLRVPCQISYYKDRAVLSLPSVADCSFQSLFEKFQEQYPKELLRLGDVPWIQDLVKKLRQRSERITTAESCTGGLISSFLTDIPGSSEVFWGGLVTYSNEAKIKLLNVPKEILETYGAVSLETVTRMAEKAALLGSTEWGLAVSGIAGPGGGSEEKPVGTVCIALVGPKVHIKEKLLFHGNREQIRHKTAIFALLLLENSLQSNSYIDRQGWNAYI
ncbi:MAG: CinA family protein [Spirochaetales bacterium]